MQGDRLRPVRVYPETEGGTSVALLTNSNLPDEARAHLGHSPDFPIIRSTPAALLASMDRLGIQLTCLSSIQAIHGDAEHGNVLVTGAVRAHPGRFFGYLVVDVGYPEKVAAQLAGGLAAGFRGVKVRMVGDEIVIRAPGYPPLAVTSIYGKKWSREA